MKVNSFEKSSPREGAQIAVWNKRLNTWVIDEVVRFEGGTTLNKTNLFDATHWISLPKNPTEKGV